MQSLRFVAALLPAVILTVVLAALPAACAPLSAGVAVQPLPSATQPAALGEDVGWASYTHPEWGITVHYPSAWTLSVPDFDKLAAPPAEGVPEGYTYNPNVEQMRLLGYGITLDIPDANGAPRDQVYITLDTFTLSPGTDLQTWVDLRNQLDAATNPLADETTVTPIDAAALPFAQAGDQVVYQVIENRLLHNETIWIAQGELVFLVMNNSADPQVHEQFFQVASTLEFDPGQLAAIRAKAPFAGDEQQMEETVARLQPQPTAECDIVCRDQKAYDAMMAGRGSEEAEGTTSGPSPLPTPRATAQPPLTPSSVLATGLAVEPDQVHHYFYHIYTRLPETIPDPPDPYHLPTTTFLAEHETIEVWAMLLNGEPAFHSIARIPAGSGQTRVSYEVITRADGSGTYFAGSNIAFLAFAEGDEAAAVAEEQAQRRAEDRARIDRSAKVTGTAQDEWGRAAWIVEFGLEPATPQDYDFTGQLGAAQPYGADLAFSTVQRRWLVDQATGEIIRRELWAMTQPQPTLLQHETQTPPEVLAAAAVDIPMDRFITPEAQAALAFNRAQESTPSRLGSFIGDLNTIARTVPFRVYELPQAALDALGHGRAVHSARYSLVPCAFRGPVYDFEMCAGSDGTVEITYTFQERTGGANSEVRQRIIVAQGDKQEVTRRLKQALPTWLESEPVQISVLGRTLHAWRILFFAQVPDRSGALLFEIDDAFVQVTGYGVPLDDLTHMAEQLQPVTPAEAPVSRSLLAPRSERP